MADGEESLYKVEYLDGEEGESYNWVKRPGYVRITYASGSTFEGVLNEERLKHGQGVYKWKKAGEEGEEPVTKATYDGEYVNGQKQGLGKFTYPNGDVYHGQFQQNKPHGEGSYLYKSSGDIYSGTWVDGIKSGEGSYQFGADHSILKGTWTGDFIASAKWILTDGTVYSGSFQCGKPTGPGSFHLPSGITQSGEYVVTNPPAEGEEAAAANLTVTWVGTPVVMV